MLITDVCLDSGVCIWLKAHMHQIPSDIILNMLLHATAWLGQNRVSEKVNLGSYQKPLTNMDYIPNHTWSLNKGSAHRESRTVQSCWLFCVKSTYWFQLWWQWICFKTILKSFWLIIYYFYSCYGFSVIFALNWWNIAFFLCMFVNMYGFPLES